MKNRLLLVVVWLCSWVGASAQTIVKAEYFVDTDPGINAATDVPITSGASISNVTFNQSLTSLSAGMHHLFFRVKDSNGFWSTTERTPFYNLVPTTVPAAVNVTNAEYFVDTDPGIGAATGITITPGLVITDLILPLNVSSLAEGNHILFVRFKDANNNWSVSQPTGFSVCNQAAPIASAGTVVSTTGFTANWAAATGATSYRLDVSADNFATFVSGNNDRTVTGATTASVTGAAIGTAYKYRVRAVNATCASVSSSPIDVTTLFTTPTASSASAITTTGFTANWNAVTNATGYRLDVSLDNFATLIAGFDNKTVTATNDVVTGLTAATAYKYRVRAVNAGGALSANSTAISVTTATAIAAPVANAATVITTTGFTANWATVSGATGYRLDVSTDNFGTFVTGFSDKPVTPANDVVTGLTAATVYKYRVRAVNANGTSVNSNVISVTTLPKQNQTITFAALSAKSSTDAPFTLTATASSNLPISYSSSNTAVATISGSTVTIVALGSTTITASQAGDGNYNAATTVTQTLTVTTKQSQTITFAALAAKTFGDAAFTLSATASSQLGVSYTSSNTAVATVSGSTVTIVGAGETTITASQAGDASFNAASNVDQSLVVNKANQTITFATLPTKKVGDAAFTLTATGGASSLPVTFVSSNTAVATISGSTVTIVAAGSAIITANQAGNSNYNAAAEVFQTLTVEAKQNQTITFAAIADKTLGGAAFALTATASSALSVIYATTSDKITISSSQVTLVKAGRATITASQAGDANFNAAVSVDQSFCIKPAKPTITVSGVNTDAVTLTSSASAGNQWFKDGTAIIGATNATLSVTAVGVYKVQVKVDDCLSEFSNDTPFIITGDLNIASSEITIYPNPVEDYIEVRGLKGEISNSQLSDMTGKTNTLILEQKNSIHRANVQHLAAGVYLLRVQQDNSIHQIKFIKK